MVSLARCFEAARQRAGLRAIVLSDDAGLSIAGAGPAGLCDDLAARAALAPRPANDTVPSRLDVLARTLEVRRLSIDGIEVFLCAEGPVEDAGQHLTAAIAGCQRILGRRRGT